MSLKSLRICARWLEAGGGAAMMKRPAFQFYPADWRKDAALQSCSVAAQGLWINAMCIAHECEPYGHLTVNGRAMSPAQVARLVGLSAKECEGLLLELKDAGVSAYTEDGALYSRRMVRDEALRNKRASGGAAGGEHGSKGAAHGSKGGRPKDPGRGGGDDGQGGLNNPPSEAQSGNGEPPNKPPPSSSSSSSSEIQTDNHTQAEPGSAAGAAEVCVLGITPSPQGEAYAALRDAGVTDANPADPVLKGLLAQGVDVPELLAATAVAAKAGRHDMGYIVGIVRNKRADAERLKLAPPVPVRGAVTVASNDAELTRKQLEAEQRKGYTKPSKEMRAKLEEAKRAAAAAGH